MSRARRDAALVLAAASAVGGGCGGSRTAPAAAPTATAADDVASADILEHDSHHHYGGLPMLVALSVDTLGASPVQQPAIDGVRADLFRRMEPARSAEQALLDTLASGVAAGAIDSSRVDDLLAQLATATNGLDDTVAFDLRLLHSLLRPEQRAALVEKVEANWTIWQRANGREPTMTPGSGRLDPLAAELGLTPAQVETARAALLADQDGSRPIALEEVEAEVRSFESFRGDDFDSSALTSNASSVHLASWGAARMARFYETVNPVLSPEQRLRLASILREHAAHTEEERRS